MKTLRVRRRSRNDYQRQILDDFMEEQKNEEKKSLWQIYNELVCERTEKGYQISKVGYAVHDRMKLNCGS